MDLSQNSDKENAMKSTNEHSEDEVQKVEKINEDIKEETEDCDVKNLDDNVKAENPDLENDLNNAEESKPIVVDDETNLPTEVTSEKEVSDANQENIEEAVVVSTSNPNISVYDVANISLQSINENEEGQDKTASKKVYDTTMDMRDELDFEEDKESGEESDGEETATQTVPETRNDHEEGELTEDEDAYLLNQEPKMVCRFFNKGQCTWGTNCRFLHPGVSDKGNYNMFAAPKPEKQNEEEEEETEPARLVPEPPAFETAWERGLRHAKEMKKRAEKRRETDADFEEKRFNLSLGQAELDREQDYYTRPASPLRKEDDDLDPYERQAVRYLRGGHFDNLEVRYRFGLGAELRSRRERYELGRRPEEPIKEARYPRPEGPYMPGKGPELVAAAPRIRRYGSPVPAPRKPSKSRSYSSGSSSSRSSLSSRSSTSSSSRSRSRSSDSSSRSITPPLHPRQRAMHEGASRGRGRGAGSGFPPTRHIPNQHPEGPIQYGRREGPPPSRGGAAHGPAGRGSSGRETIVYGRREGPSTYTPGRGRGRVGYTNNTPSKRREEPDILNRGRGGYGNDMPSTRGRGQALAMRESHNFTPLTKRLPIIKDERIGPNNATNPPAKIDASLKRVKAETNSEPVDEFGRTIRKAPPPKTRRSPEKKSPVKRPARRKFSLSPSGSESSRSGSSSSSGSRSYSNSSSKSSSFSRSRSRSPRPGKRKREKLRPKMIPGTVSLGTEKVKKSADILKQAATLKAQQVGGLKQQLKVTVKNTQATIKDKVIHNIDDDSGESDTETRIPKKQKLEEPPARPVVQKEPRKVPSATALASLTVPSKADQGAKKGESGSKKPTAARREELLKQLRAVEDAIARKRSKPMAT